MTLGLQLTANAIRWSKVCRSRDDDSTVINRTLREFEATWKTRAGRAKLVSGKYALSELNGALASRGIPIVTPNILIDQMSAEKEYDDLKETLRALNEFCLAE